MMAVVFATHLVEAPSRSQEGGELSADDHAAPALAAGREPEVLFDIVLEESADIARVVEIALGKLPGFVSAEILAQQPALLRDTIGLVASHVGRELAPALTFLPAGERRQIFVRGAVALVAVLARKDQH